MLLCFAAVLACLLAGHSILFAILLGMVLFCGLGLRRGFSLRELGSMAWKKGREALIVAAVLLSIGVLSALWRTSGTMAWFLYHGLRLISPNTFLLVVFLLCAVLSMLLGTAFGVTGPAGVSSSPWPGRRGSGHDGGGHCLRCLFRRPISPYPPPPPWWRPAPRRNCTATSSRWQKPVLCLPS